MITFFRNSSLCGVFLLLLVSSYLNGQWEMRYPDIQTSFISDMIFINSTNGYFVNSAGSIMRTTDGGTTWKRQAQFKGQDLGLIRFLDEKIGYVVSHSTGGGAGFYYTTDGGSYWKWSNTEMSDAADFIPVSSSIVLKAAGQGSIRRLDNFFGNWETVYKMGVFVRGDVVSSFGSILKFQKLSGKVLALGNSEYAKKAGVISDSVSFILSSTDQGTKWDTLWCNFSYIMNTFRFADDKNGWMGGESRHIYKTTDGGKSWKLQFSDSTKSPAVRDLFVFDSLNIYAADDLGNVISTTDGGTKWTVKKISDYKYSTSYLIRFANPQKGFLIGPDLWTTDNSGQSWGRFSKSIKDNINKIDFVNEKLGWAISEQVIYNTTDGGYNWTAQYTLNTSSNYLSGLDMIDSVNGWAVGNNILYHTTDGKTWQSSVVDPNLIYIRGVNFYDKSTGILFECWNTPPQNQLSNYVTTDGGVTWKKYPLSILSNISSYFKVDYSDKAHLWFSNQQGLWLSHDQGKTWSVEQYKGYVPSFTAVDFLDSLNGWKVDGFDSVSVTSDGGNTWITKAKPGSQQTTDLVTIGKVNGGQTYALESGLYGSLSRYYSSQYYNAISEDTYTRYSLNSIAQYNSGNNAHIWVAGDGFTVLYLKDFILTDVNKNEMHNDTRYSLSQNYPNPFNPVTSIAYSIPKLSYVELKVYDLLGREVSVLVSKEQSAGEYKVQFNASSLPSGIYIYTIQAGQYRDSKKLMLLK